MSFRFVGTALSILGTGASGVYLATETVHTTPRVVVAVTKTEPAAPAPVMAARQPYTFVDGSYWQPRVWVGAGAVLNPVTGAPLSREEGESGWVDGPPDMRYEVAAQAASVPVAMMASPSPSPSPSSAQPAPHPAKPAPATSHAAPHAPHADHAAKDGHGKDSHGKPKPAAQAQAQAQAHQADTGYRIHLESYRDDKLLKTGWNELRAAYPAVLDKLSPSSAKVTIPKKGVFVRLMAGPFSNKADAEHACAELQKSHHYCQLRTPGQA